MEFPSNLSIFFCCDAPLESNSSYVPKALGILDKIDRTDPPKLIKQNIMGTNNKIFNKSSHRVY